MQSHLSLIIRKLQTKTTIDHVLPPCPAVLLPGIIPKRQ